MRKALWALLNLVAFQYFLVFTTKAMVQEKADAGIPVTTLSPPEGNTTFLGGTSWCVARPGSSPVDLQVALDWACGLGKADCGPIQADGPCFEPDTLLSHASFAFNNYYQQNGNSDIACYFGGTAALTQNNPSECHIRVESVNLRLLTLLKLNNLHSDLNKCCLLSLQVMQNVSLPLHSELFNRIFYCNIIVHLLL
ncbi:hypothetical protein Pfo_012614 [Paulownia fortunei]|nr:hypothetical protein Pfo_012614 [Paulownia fortunei]